MRKTLPLWALTLFVLMPYLLHGAERGELCSENAPGDNWLGRWKVESHYWPEQTAQVWRWWFEVLKQGQGYQIQTHTQGPAVTEVIDIDPHRLEFLFHDALGTHITTTRDGEDIIGIVVQPQNKSLPSGWIIGQRVFDPCSNERMASLSGKKDYDLNGHWIYQERGYAEIIHEMRLVRILMTWAPSSLPVPHYEIYASLNGRWLVGQWKYVSSGEHDLRKAGRFRAEVSEDGNSIHVLKALDNDPSWNGIVFTRSVVAVTDNELPLLNH